MPTNRRDMVLAGMIAHEMRSMLTPVLGHIRLASEHPKDHSKVNMALDRMATAVRRAVRLAELVLTPDAEHAPCNLQTVLDELWVEHGARVEFAGSALPTATIDCDSIRHVLSNIVQNAMRHSPAAASIRVSTRLAPPPPIGEDCAASCSTWNISPAVLIEVRDSGRGIPADRLPTVFTPWESGGGGFGLGLALCARLVHGANGMIHVRSRPSEGTCVTICLCPAYSLGRQQDDVDGINGNGDARIAA